MTSKKYVYELTLEEALQKLDYTLYDRNCDIRVIKARQQLIDVIRKETNKLKKDLEVLEILRDKAKHLYDESKENEYIIIELNDEVLNNDFEIVKNWLERKE